MLTIEPARRPELLIWTNLHTVGPGGEPRLIGEQLLPGVLLQTAADLPGAETCELCDEQRTDHERQPPGQFFRRVFHVIPPIASLAVRRGV